MTLPPKVSHPNFLNLIHAMDEKLIQMEASPAVPYPFRHDASIKAGVYVFYLGDEAQYAGRSNRIHKRLKEHSQIGSGYRSAAFAVRMVRHDLGLERTYHLRRGESGHPWEAQHVKDAFAAAKEKIRDMSVRVIEEANPTRQALLEIYVATRLGCPYNDFDNH